MNLLIRLKRNSCLLMLAIVSCIEPYTLTGIESNPDFLVVDAFINATDLTASAKLSRAVSLDFSGTPPAELNAEVIVESEQGEEYILQEINVQDFPNVDPGTYIAENIPVDLQKRYRLKITLNNGNGREYVSEFIQIQKAAKIESVQWEPAEEGLRILVNTSDDGASSDYYRWRYQETWQYNTPYFSGFLLENGEARLRNADEYIYTCYRNEPSYEILIGSSQNLVSNVIRNFELKTIPRSSIRLSNVFSINVQQFALTEDAYTYWLNLFKTTENMGGLFDPMPGQVTGNMQSVSDPGELVIGFFSGSTVEEERIFIQRNELPRDYLLYRPPFCKIDTILVEDIPTAPNSLMLMSSVLANGFPVIIGYTSAERSCLDCRAFGGGITTKPDFWP